MGQKTTINHSKVYVNNHKHKGNGLFEQNSNLTSNSLYKEIIKSKNEEIKFLRETIKKLLDFPKIKAKKKS